MISTDYVAEMAAYNRWQNDTVFRLCDEIGEAERTADRRMYFNTIHHTLDHMCMVKQALMSYLNNRVPPPSDYREIVWPVWEDLKAERERGDAALEACAKFWTDIWMAETVVMNSPRLEKKPRMPRWIMVVQIFNHETHHRSQVTVELHRMGLGYEPTDMPFRPGADYFDP